jgi:4-amino-4-deoxy-L-arabinose transferase-like glycosyltransferase
MGFSHGASPDMPFSALLCVAMICAAVVLGLDQPAGPGGAPKTSWLALFLFGLFLGAAVLAKGPAALLLSGGGIFFWSVSTKRWREVLRLVHPAAVLTFLLTALPWYLLCARRNPDFFRVFIVEHNFKRYLTPEFQHVQPFWFYGPVLLVAFLPWLVILLSGAIRGVRRLWQTQRAQQSTLFLVCWALFGVLFFTLSRSKLPGYVLPSLPPIGLLMARETTRIVRKQTSRVSWPSLGVGFTLASLGIVVVLLRAKIPVVPAVGPSLAVAGFAGSLMLSGTVVLVLGVLRRRLAGMLCAAMAFPLFLLLGAGDLSELDAGVSARRAAERALSQLSAEEIRSAAAYKVPRGLKYSLNFYLHREVAEWPLQAGPASVVFTLQKNFEELQTLGLRCSREAGFPALGICSDSSPVFEPNRTR